MSQPAIATVINPNTALLSKLVKIYEKVDAVEKSGYNKFQNYSYVRATDVARAIRKALREENIFARTEFQTLRTYEIPAKEGVMQAVDVLCSVEFIDAGTGASIKSNGLGTGADKGDKAGYKAQTGGIKYALRNAFLIPDEADPEATDPETGKNTTENQPERTVSSAPAQDLGSRPKNGQTPKRGRPRKTEQPPDMPANANTADSSHFQATDEDLPPSLWPEGADPDSKVFSEDGKLVEPYRTRATKLMDNLASGKPALQASADPPLSAGQKFIKYLLTATSTKNKTDLTAQNFDTAVRAIEGLLVHETTRPKAISLIESAKGANA